MGRLLVVDSRDLTEYAKGPSLPLLVEELCRQGYDVTLFLVENGVIAARRGAAAGLSFDALSGTGVHILADDVACRARGIRELASGVCLSDLDHLADKIAEGFDNILWY